MLAGKTAHKITIIIISITNKSDANLRLSTDKVTTAPSYSTNYKKIAATNAVLN